MNDYLQTLPTAAEFYAVRRGTRTAGNLAAIARGEVAVLPDVVSYVESGEDFTVGGYSSFAFVEEYQGGNDVCSSLDAVIQELAENAVLYAVPHALLHFYTHIHMVPAHPERGGILYDDAMIERMLDCTQTILASCQ